MVWEIKPIAVSYTHLARALIRQPDLLLLDEPGNHLDLPTLLWLESFLQTWQGSFVLVSHDNTLLDAVTNASWILRDQTLHSLSLIHISQTKACLPIFTKSLAKQVAKRGIRVNAVAPVSYTHLDVYKRQRINSLVLSSMRMNAPYALNIASAAMG